MADDDDPFECFGDDDDDDASPAAGEEPVATTPKASSGIDASGGNDVKEQHHCRRNFENGVLAFHPGTEQALLLHVEKKMAHVLADSINNQDGDDNYKAQVVLDAIDHFCYNRHWMMHVGASKGQILTTFLHELHSSTNIQDKANLLELGTYCGYSSILITKVLRDIIKTKKKSDDDSSTKFTSFSFYTVEVVEQNVEVSKRLIQLAGFEHVIHVLHFNPLKESLATFLEKEMYNPASTNKIDFLFIDHDKDLYLQALQELESAGYIQKGTHVAADNVVFAKIDNYRNYLSNLAEQGIVRTHLEDTWLEYSVSDTDDEKTRDERLRDGIGQFPSFLCLLLH